jgi:hypothetical protein
MNYSYPPSLLHHFIRLIGLEMPVAEPFGMLSEKLPGYSFESPG